MEEFNQQFLPASEKYATIEEVRALIANSMTGITSPLTVKSSYMQSADFVSGSKGWRFDSIGNLEANNGYFRGDITGATGTFSGTVNIGSLNIPDATTVNSAHIDSAGNSWWGCNVADFSSDHANANAYILNDGAAVFTDIILTGLQAGSSIDGTYITSLAVSKLATGTISSKQITLGITAGTGDSYINSGKTDFTNTDSGFILGVDDSDSDTAKFFIGDSGKYLNWDGDNLDITSSRQLEVFTAGEAITAGQPLCMGRGCYDHDLDEQIIAFRSAGVDSSNPDTNYHGQYYYRINSQLDAPAKQEWVLMDFDFEDFSEVFTDCGGWFYTNSGTVNVAGPFTVDIYPITSAWDETTVTYNTLPTIGSAVGSFQVNNADGAKYHTVNLTVTMWKIKSGNITAPYGFLLKGSQSNANNGYVNLFLETSSGNEPGLRGRRMVYNDKVFRAKSSIIEGNAQEYRCFNFIGFAAESANANASVRVITQGTVSGLSNLVQNETYYIGEGIGTLDTASSLSANKPMYRVGRALSTTKLLIEKGEKVIDWVFNTAASGYVYHPTYFRPVEIETWTGTDGDAMFPGRYINQRQYTVKNLETSITTGYLYNDTDTISISYILPGGIVTTEVGDGNLCIGKIKG